MSHTHTTQRDTGGPATSRIYSPPSNQASGLEQQLSQRPWLTLGAAVAAGYLVGRMTESERDESWQPGPQLYELAGQTASMPQRLPDPSERRHDSHNTFGPLQGQVDELTATAVSTIKTMIRDLVRDYTPEAQARRRERLTDQPWPELDEDREYVKTYHPANEQRA